MAADSVFSFPCAGFMFLKLSRKSPIIWERKRGLSSAELRIHWPMGSFPSSKWGVWPSWWRRIGIQTQLLAQEFDVFFFPGQECPARPAWNFFA